MLDGTNPMTAIEEMVHGLPRPTVSKTVNYLDHNSSADDRIIEFYRACGFDPNSDNLARLFNLPLIEDLPCKPYLPRSMNILT